MPSDKMSEQTCLAMCRNNMVKHYAMPQRFRKSGSGIVCS